MRQIMPSARAAPGHQFQRTHHAHTLKAPFLHDLQTFPTRLVHGAFTQ